jgi:hypothetical protein
MFANIAAECARVKAAELEMAAKRGDAPTIQVAFGELDREIDRLCAVLRSSAQDAAA